LTIEKGLFHGNKNACSVGELYPLFSLDQWFSNWAESLPWWRFWGVQRRKNKQQTKGVIEEKINTKGVKNLNHQSII